MMQSAWLCCSCKFQCAFKLQMNDNFGLKCDCNSILLQQKNCRFEILYCALPLHRDLSCSHVANYCLKIILSFELYILCENWIRVFQCRCAPLAHLQSLINFKYSFSRILFFFLQFMQVAIISNQSTIPNSCVACFLNFLVKSV